MSKRGSNSEPFAHENDALTARPQRVKCGEMARWRVKSRILKATKGPGNEVVKLVFYFSYEKKSSGFLTQKKSFFSKIGEKFGVQELS